MNTKQLISNNFKNCEGSFQRIENIALFNQRKVLKVFQKNRIALRHFAATTGYGYDDIGRDTLCNVFADVFNTEAAIVSPLIANGTHAITLALQGYARPNDVILSISGNPYDTLSTVIFGKDCGSLADFGIGFEIVDLLDGDFDYDLIKAKIEDLHPKMIYIQRSRGYEWRSALCIKQIEKACSYVKNLTNAKIFVDNCYGEFVEELEPTNVGADVCMGSLIKNIGGGLCPTGGYIVGPKEALDKIAFRLTAPGIGMEVGSYFAGYQYFYQGLFMAPHTVAQALKTATLFSSVLSDLGFDVKPKPSEQFYDIVCSIKFNDREKLIKFVQSVQYVAPVDSHVTPEAWDMPGYNDQVIMSAGCFVQGSSIEMSCDAPIKPPYIAYFQGGLTFEHGILALESVLETVVGKKHC